MLMHYLTYHASQQASTVKKAPMLILYGSNSGTCEALAYSMANTASGRGYDPEVRTLDEVTGKVPNDRPVFIATASYEGQPTDNAVHFVEWLGGLENKELEGVRYAVFGCGNRMSLFLPSHASLTM